MTDINLTDVEKGFNLSLTPKHVEDPEDAKQRRFKDKWLFIATLIALAIMYLICIYILIIKEASPYTGTALNGVIGLTLAI